MARARVSESLANTATGLPIAGATIEVRDFGGGTPTATTLYANATGGTLFNGTADAGGAFTFYVDTPKRFDLYITAPGFTPITLTREAQSDPDDVIRTSGTQTRGAGLTLTSPVLNSPTINAATFSAPSFTNPTLAGGSWSGATITDSTLDDLVSATVLGPFAAHGVGTATPGQGLQVYADGTVGISDGTFVNKSAFNLIEVIKTVDTAFNLMDVFGYNESTGDTPHANYDGADSGTATAVGAATLTMTGAGWMASPSADPVHWDLRGLFAEITQAGLEQAREVISNTATQITVDPAWDPPLTGTPTFVLKQPVDTAIMRVNTYVQPPSGGGIVKAHVRQIETHFTVREGAARTGAQGIEGGGHIYKEYTDTDRYVGVNFLWNAGDLDPVPSPRQRGNVTFRSAGSSGVMSHFKGLDWQGNVVFDVAEFGDVFMNTLEVEEQASLAAPATGEARIGVLTSNRLAYYPDGGAQTTVADQLRSATLLAQAAGDGVSGVIEISGIPATYRALYVEIAGRSTTAGTSAAVRLTFETSPTSGAYFHQLKRANNATVSASQNPGTSDFISIGAVSGDGSTASLYGMIRVSIPEYANTSVKKNVLAHSAAATNLATGEMFNDDTTGHWNATTAIDRLRFTLSTGAWTTASRISVWVLPSNLG